jgi:hypothetical protein
MQSSQRLFERTVDEVARQGKHQRKRRDGLSTLAALETR